MSDVELSRIVALLRYHHPRQFLWRGYRTLQRKVRLKLPEAFVFAVGRHAIGWRPGAKDAFRAISRHRIGLWPNRASCVAEFAQGTLKFLGHAVSLSHRNKSGERIVDWNPKVPRLWKFHLQCQEYLHDLAFSVGRDVASEWLTSWLDEIRHRHPMRDPDAWHPFCISRRLPVWLASEADYEIANLTGERFWGSMAAQLVWLRKNLEWDLGGNHLLENLTALYLAACFLEGNVDLEQRWIENRLLSELRIQILPTGEHFERTPTYHALMMVCVLQCAEAAQFAGSPVYDSLVSTLKSMTNFIEFIASPDRRIPLLADSVVCETPDLTKLVEWAEEHIGAGEGRRTDGPNIDYWRNDSGTGNQILLDAGPIACDHLPAHGHGDLMQVTATIAGCDAIVDTGNFQYEPGEMRLHCRGTKSHNVLQIGNQQHGDIWSSFRMGRRGHPIWKTESELGHWRWVAAAHDGFAFPSGRVIVASEDQWTIIDWFDADTTTEMPAVTRLHWHPNWSLRFGRSSNIIEAIEGTQATVKSLIEVDSSRANEVTIEEAFYCPDFGCKIPNQVLVNRIVSASNAWLRSSIQVNLDQPSVPIGVELGAKRIFISVPDQARLAIDLSNGQFDLPCP